MTTRHGSSAQLSHSDKRRAALQHARAAAAKFRAEAQQILDIHYQELEYARRRVAEHESAILASERVSAHKRSVHHGISGAPHPICHSEVTHGINHTLVPARDCDAYRPYVHLQATQVPHRAVSEHKDTSLTRANLDLSAPHPSGAQQSAQSSGNSELLRAQTKSRRHRRLALSLPSYSDSDQPAARLELDTVSPLVARKPAQPPPFLDLITLAPATRDQQSTAGEPRVSVVPPPVLVLDSRTELEPCSNHDHDASNASRRPSVNLSQRQQKSTARTTSTSPQSTSPQSTPPVLGSQLDSPHVPGLARNFASTLLAISRQDKPDVLDLAAAHCSTPLAAGPQDSPHVLDLAAAHCFSALASGLQDSPHVLDLADSSRSTLPVPGLQDDADVLDPAATRSSTHVNNATVEPLQSSTAHGSDGIGSDRPPLIDLTEVSPSSYLDRQSDLGDLCLASARDPAYLDSDILQCPPRTALDLMMDDNPADLCSILAIDIGPPDLHDDDEQAATQTPTPFTSALDSGLSTDSETSSQAEDSGLTLRTPQRETPSIVNSSHQPASDLCQHPAFADLKPIDQIAAESACYRPTGLSNPVQEPRTLGSLRRDSKRARYDTDSCLCDADCCDRTRPRTAFIVRFRIYPPVRPPEAYGYYHSGATFSIMIMTHFTSSLYLVY